MQEARPSTPNLQVTGGWTRRAPSWAAAQPLAVPTKTTHRVNDINPPKDSGCSLQKKEEQMQGGHKNTKYPLHKESGANAVCLGVGPISAIK